MTRAEFLRCMIATGAGTLVGGCGWPEGSAQATPARKNRLSPVPASDPPAAGPGTPLLQYPGITLEEIAAVWPGFSQPLPPKLIAGKPIIETTFAGLVKAAQANPGRRIRVTRSDATGIAKMTSVTDVEVLIPDGVDVGTIRADDGCMRLRVCGEGPSSRVRVVRVGGGAHCTFHGLLLRGSDSSAPMRVARATGPTAFISCIAGSGGSSASDIALNSHADDLLIAGCNLGADGNAGRNDWCLRFGESHRVVMVDCFCEARGLQPVIRRSSGSSQFLFKRVTTYNSVDDEAFADNGVGDGSHIQKDCHLHDCVSYVGGKSGLRFGGYNLGPTDHSAIWRVHNHVFYSNGKRIDDATLAQMERRAPNRGDWRYRLGAPRYENWDGKTHPGWPQRTGMHGKPMAISDPYAL